MKYIKLSNINILIIVYVLIITKIIIYIVFQEKISSIPSDADYYHEVAIGYQSYSVNIWPDILEYLNSIGLYNRYHVSLFLLFLNLIVIPAFFLKLSNLRFRNNQRDYLIALFVITIYPTLYYYTFDIFRDVFMVTIYLLACILVKNFFFENNIVKRSILFVLIIFMIVFLYELRAYLGIAFGLSFFIFKINFTKKRIFFLIFIYFIALFTLNYFGFFSSIIDYRERIFTENSGGSTIGIDFSNPILFLPNLFLSMITQLFGIYLFSLPAIFLFLFETIPVIYMIRFIIKNIRISDKFVRFLAIFFILYASIWLIGNDNLGTAIRLRLYNYLAIYICFFYMKTIINKAYK